MCACWVEVPQHGSVPLIPRLALLLRIAALRVDMVCDEELVRHLCVAIRICGAEGATFRDWDHVGETSRIAVDSGRRGEDDVRDVVTRHGAQQANSAVDVDAVVLKRDFSRLADSL